MWGWYHRFHDDNAYGAAANALEFIKTWEQWQLRVGDGFLIALLMILIGVLGRMRRELMLLREQLAAEKRNP